jgi:hypothetical protein
MTTRLHGHVSYQCRFTQVRVPFNVSTGSSTTHPHHLWDILLGTRVGRQQLHHVLHSSTQNTSATRELTMGQP